MFKVDLVEVIQGARHTDSRGSIIFFNQLSLESVKRFYKIEPSGTDTVRAWQGHKEETKWFYVLSGSFTFVLVKPDNWDNPSESIEVRKFFLSSNTDEILHVPKGYANGFKANELNSAILIFSDRTLEESLLDDYRYDKDLWYKWD